MSLILIATPIGTRNLQDLSQRAQDAIRKCDLVIGEERKETSQLLKLLGIQKSVEYLNEHSKPADVEALARICQEKTVALVTDCGTPGFCDPGADLVRICRAKDVAVTSILGPSALMGLISLSGIKLDEFVFRGFLSADSELRRKQILDLKRESRPVVLMDTPYRLHRLLEELGQSMPQRMALLACDLATEQESIHEATLQKLSQLPAKKAEFMLLLHSLPTHRSPSHPAKTAPRNRRRK